MDAIGVGVIGCGFVGAGAHVPAFSAIEGAQLVAVADRDENRLNKVAKKHGVKSAYSDYAQLVNDPEVDAVVVAVPTPLHVPAAMAALRAGKHVLCEMPLAARLEQADQLIDAAKQAGLILMPSLTFRFTPTFVKAKEIIQQKELGAVAAVLYREFIPARDLAKQWPAGSWVWNESESGGPLFTLAVWSIDLLRWLLDGEVTHVHAAAKYTTLDQFGGTLGYDACAVLTLANGVVGSLQYSGSVPDSASNCLLEVVGTATKVVQVSGNDRLTLLDQTPAKIEWNLKQSGPRQWGHYQQDEHFIRCLLEGRQPSVTPQDGRRAMEIALEIAPRN